MLLVGDWVPEGKHVTIDLGSIAILANLEGPVLHSDHLLEPAPKAGPSIFSTQLPTEAARFVFVLANNHIMDYGTPGLDATLNVLGQRQFRFCGAGRDVSEARRPIVVEESGLQIGILSCCEAQFGVASAKGVGTAEFGPWMYQAIDKLRRTVDAVIVSVHAAVEDSPWPSPYIRQLYRSYIDAGATVVHGHHAHVPQGYEAYGDGVIFYGMGNFAVDPDRWRDYPNGMWSLAAEIDFKSKPVGWRPLTLVIRHQTGSDSIVIEEGKDNERARHRRYLEVCNRPLDNPVLFDALWQEVAVRAYYHHGAGYMRFAAFPQSGRRVQARAGLLKLKRAMLNRIGPSFRPSQYDYLLWYHMIACESHRQMLVTALGVLAGEIKDLRTVETGRLADDMMLWPTAVKHREYRIR